MQYIKENLEEFEYCGILDWHKAGYTGKGVKIANFESNVDINLPFFNGKINDPLKLGGNQHRNTHGQKTLDVMCQVAYDSDFFIFSVGGSYSPNSIDGVIVDTLNYLENNSVQLVNASLVGTDHPVLNERITNIKSKNKTIFNTSAGNTGEKGLGRYARSGVWWSIGAVHWNYSQNKPVYAKYSSVGEKLLFTSFSNLYIHDAKTLGRVFPQEGTSFSSPLFTAMIALYMEFFKEKVGRFPTEQEVILFCLDNVEDLGEPGQDIKFGYGLFRLPKNPNLIDISKYIIKPKEDDDKQDKKEIVNKTIHLYIGSSIIEVNGIEKTIDVSPFVNIDDRTLVPIRFISEELGAVVNWDGSNQQITISDNGIVIKMWINKKQIDVNGNIVSLDTVPILLNNRTFVPVRHIAEILNCDVEWIGSEQKIIIRR